MTIIGFDGIQVIIKVPAWEYKRMVKALANLDNDDSEEN